VNVAELQSFRSSEQFLAHARGLPRVILEGASDVELFKSWFEDLQAEFEFMPAEDVGDFGGGCTAVAPAVRHSWDQDIPALGVLDRDSLHRLWKWDLLFSTDPAALDGASGDDDVKVASLWEIEAYLLEPQLMGPWVGVQRKPLPAKAHEMSSALTKALEECEALLEATPYFAAWHKGGRACDPRYFRDDQAAHITETCQSAIAKGTDEDKAVAAEVEAYVAALRTAAPADPAERLVFLLRYVDTKRLLGRLEHRLKLNGSAHHALKILMQERDLRPDELRRFLEEAADRFRALES
jgi:hypothetical protein